MNNLFECLGVSEIDVLLIYCFDVLMEVDEVVEVFFELHKVGKVKYFGVLNFSFC